MKGRIIADTELIRNEFMDHKESNVSHQRIEEALREGERKYRDLADSLPQTVAEIDIAGNITFTNLASFEMFGYTQKDFDRGLNIFQMIAPEEHRRAERNIQQFIEGQGQNGKEYIGVRKDGSRFPFTVYLTPVLSEDKTVGFRIILIDITERKRAEEALRTSQTQLFEAMNLAHIVYWEFDPVAQTYVFNDPFYALYGTTAEQEGGYRMTREEYAKRFIHPDDLPIFFQAVKQNVTRTGPEPLPEVEHRIIRRDGEVRYIAVRGGVIKDDKGQIVKRYGTNQDITERKKMENTLQQSEEQFRKMFEGNPIGMVMVDSDFRFIRANAAFCRMLGFTEKELSSLTFKDITHPDYIEEDVLRVNDLKNGKIPFYQTEKRYVRKDDAVVWGSARVNVMRDKDDRLLYFLTTVEDITEQKRSEEERTRLEAQLFQSQKMEAIGTLAGGIAHDFNNILTALVGYAALLKMKLSKGILSTYVDQILSASQKAADLIRELLTFSRQEAVSLKPISLHSVIKGTEKLLQRLVTEDIELRIKPSKEKIVIMADLTQIDQILMNLVTNARDAMPKGGSLTIETKMVELDDEFRRIHGYGKPGVYVLLSVSDTGSGMDEKTREKIFDPFFTTKEVGKGTGLGLSTVYGIVKQHDGYITVHSEPGIGTTFHIYLPVANEAGKEESPSPAPAKEGNETILIAEDDETLRGLLSQILIAYGYTTIQAIDGVDAIEQFKKADKIDLLILDSVMPKRNGREAYEEIRKIRPDVKVLFTSGYTKDVILDKGIREEGLNFLGKPISPDTLLEKVRDVLDDGKHPH
ncbi:MAG TPA: PAS domain S-box protein [Syntrophorhabdaceae bacterium]|nr:PAS domain S-box protein [Syntrophorhabdaceae bacterium]